jgi:hypothetical protein
LGSTQELRCKLWRTSERGLRHQAAVGGAWVYQSLLSTAQQNTEGSGDPESMPFRGEASFSLIDKKQLRFSLFGKLNRFTLSVAQSLKIRVWFPSGSPNFDP